MGVPGPSVPVDSALTSGRKGHGVQADESPCGKGLFRCSRDAHPRPLLSLIGRDPDWQVVPVAGVLVASDWEQRQGAWPEPGMWLWSVLPVPQGGCWGHTRAWDVCLWK